FALFWSSYVCADPVRDNQSCMQTTKPEIAVPACKRLLNVRNFKRNVILNNLGAALDNDEKYDEALEALNKSIELDPSFAFAWQNRGVAWYRKGELDKAISDIEMSLRLNPRNGAAYSTLGMIKLDARDLRGCLSALDKSVE